MLSLNRAIYDKYIEFLALDAVISKLDERGWHWSPAPKLNQRGFDLIAIKNSREIKIEVKGRGIGKYSKKQENDNRRHFNFSKAQYDTSDYFIPVFVSPKFKTCVVIPKREFDKFTTPKKPYRITLDIDTKNDNAIKPRRYQDGRKLDPNNCREGWELLNCQ